MEEADSGFFGIGVLVSCWLLPWEHLVRGAVLPLPVKCLRAWLILLLHLCVRFEAANPWYLGREWWRLKDASGIFCWGPWL